MGLDPPSVERQGATAADFSASWRFGARFKMQKAVDRGGYIMDVQALLSELAIAPGIVRALCAGVPRKALLQRPSPDGWCMLEVACHLLHEERHDFRPRLEATLLRPHEPWPDSDWDGWMAPYQVRPPELAETLDAWEAERQRSLEWLRRMDAPNWDATYQASWGAIRAGDVLAAWAAHDIHHQRQLVRLRYGRVVALAAPYGVRYAGEW